MTIRSKQLVINHGQSSSITAFADRINGDYGILIKSVDGWDEHPDIIRNTSKRLFGNGVYASQSAKYDKRDISITCFAKYPNEVDIRNLRTNIRLIGERINGTINIAMAYFEDGKKNLEEVLFCQIADDYFESWEELDNGVVFTLNFFAPTPYKAIFLNGSTTPETEGRL